MILKLLRLLLSTIIFSLCAVFTSAQDTRFPAILIKGADVSLIECEIARVLDDATVTFKPTGNSGLEQGVVYAVLLNKREVTRIQVTEEKERRRAVDRKTDRILEVGRTKDRSEARRQAKGEVFEENFFRSTRP